MRLQQPATIVAAAHPAPSAAPAGQPPALAGSGAGCRAHRGPEMGASPLTSSVRQWSTPACRTDAQPGEGRIAAGTQPSAPAQASGVPRASRTAGWVGHCTNVVQKRGVRALSRRKGPDPLQVEQARPSRCRAGYSFMLRPTNTLQARRLRTSGGAVPEEAVVPGVGVLRPVTFFSCRSTLKRG